MSRLSRRSLSVLASLLLLLLCGAGCQSSRPHFKSGASSAASTGKFTQEQVGVPIDPAWRTPPKEVFRLGAGDVLELQIGDDGSTRATAAVGADGMIYYYLLAAQHVATLTLAETKALLERELLTYVRKPEITISLQTVASRRVWLMGRLNNPGLYPITGPITVLEAISRAGGLFTSRMSGTTEELADLRHSFLVRKGQPIALDFSKLLRDGDMSQNIYLQPDDYIYLPSALSREVLVLGAVKSPKAVGFMDQVTLVSVLSSAGGAVAGAQLSKVAIIRGSLTSPQIATADLAAILAGTQPDMVLEPQDIVYIPFTPWDSLNRMGAMVADIFVRSTSANEGSRAVSQKATPVSVNVGLQ